MPRGEGDLRRISHPTRAGLPDAVTYGLQLRWVQHEHRGVEPTSRNDFGRMSDPVSVSR